MKLITNCLTAVVLAVFCFFVFSWVAAGLVGILLLFFVMWLLNMRFTVTKHGGQTGTYTRKGGFVPAHNKSQPNT
jgi:hypothetical protein